MRSLVNSFREAYASRNLLYSMAAGAAVLALLALLHSTLGFAQALLVLYVLPVWLATRLGGRWAGMALVVLCSTAGTAIDAESSQGLPRLATGWFVSLGLVMLVIAHVEEALWTWRKAAMRDPLTGLLNRRALKEFAGEALHRARSLKDSLIVVVIDCDGFKRVNDQYGHIAGDLVLQMLARVLETETRESDLVARIGGDEFALVLPGSSEEEAERVMARVEKSFEARALDAGYSATVSVGLARMGEESVSIEHLLQKADTEMYSRKRQKRAQAFLN